MAPFRTSPTARLVSASIATALMGGGLIAILGLPPEIAVPFVLLAAVGMGIVGLVLGVQEHAGAVALLAILLPMALFAYVMVLWAAVTRMPSSGYAFVVAGAIPLTMTIFASATTQKKPVATHRQPATLQRAS